MASRTEWSPWTASRSCVVSIPRPPASSQSVALETPTLIGGSGSMLTRATGSGSKHAARSLLPTRRAGYSTFYTATPRKEDGFSWKSPCSCLVQSNQFSKFLFYLTIHYIPPLRTRYGGAQGPDKWFPGAIVSPHSPRKAYRTVKDNAWREESALCSPAQRYEH